MAQLFCAIHFPRIDFLAEDPVLYTYLSDLLQLYTFQ